MPAHLARDLVMLCRLTRDLPAFLRTPLSHEEAVRRLQQRLATRAERFLAMAERLVYGNPRSPYIPLLRAAGCELGDLKALVAHDGLEGALAKLADAGVSVTFDEFKGRDQRRFAFAESDFDNPAVVPHFEIRSGGTRGPGSSVKVGLPFVEDMAVNLAVAIHSQGLGDHAQAYWLLSTAVTLSLRLAKTGRAPRAWFYPLPALSYPLKAGSRWLTAVSRAAGRPLPVPRYVDLQEPERIAHWLADQVRAGQPVCLTCYASSAVRISRAAADRGVSLAGVCFWMFGEPVTEAKCAVIAASGARVVVHYGFTEGGFVGFSCAHADGADDMHLFRDAYALVQRPRAVGTTGATVPAFLLTGLLPTAPKILLNLEPGDHGMFGSRRCGCPLEAQGLTEHIGRIRSYEKLSGEGMTFVKSDLLSVLEQELPRRFGGTLTDYQLVEQEDAAGILRLHLLVNPGVGPVDEAAVRQTFLDELARHGGYAPLGADFWRRAETVQVKRQAPVATRAGKILPFQLLKP